ncbi:Putative metal-dependent hydrolase, composite domain superfamily [Colletotrichum destructivum]|uniref:Metal-dependent hydrolase, composite domain superfamily n=1 Tax=Colletotrichum destructivum TaxID=34406 RepID=A0AAX4J578_9PEZI|nr:Putative metal-dependent hydrolase, composite domain superfamily [Colletotrichum destructivum]
MVKILIQNVRVFNSEAILKPGNVVFTRSAGNIQNYMADDSDTETSDFVIDGRGCSLIPGLIDVYANIKGANAALGTYASQGVTTVLDMSSTTQQCQAMRVYAAGRTGLSTFLTSGTEASPARGYQPQLYDSPDGYVIRTREDADAFVSSRSSGPDRSDFIKVPVDPDSFDDDILKTLADAAHAHGKLIIARTAGKASYERALLAGFDVFAHAPLDAPIDTALALKMAARNVIFVPTLTMMRRRASAIGSNTNNTTAIFSPGPDKTTANQGPVEHSCTDFVPGGSYDNATQSVRTLHDADVTICAGTTANPVPGSRIPFGESLHEELRLLVEAGMPVLHVLRSATCVAATAFRLSDRGMVRGGLRADLVLVEGNPLEDITATRKIRKIWIRGEEIEPSTAAAEI